MYLETKKKYQIEGRSELNPNDFYTKDLREFLSFNPTERSQIFFKEKIVVLKNTTPLSLREIKALVLNFGAIYKNECESHFFVNNDPYFMRISDNSDKQIKGLFHNFHLNWHNDFSHTPGDFHGTALYNYKNAHIVGTQFIDTQRAYATLEDSLKFKYEGLSLSHRVSTRAFVRQKLSQAESRLLRMKKYKIKGYFSHGCINGDVLRPLFPKHPKTGKRSIYISPATVVPDILGRDYITILNHCMKYIKTFEWEDNDLLLFDNLSLMHCRSSFSGTRELHRCQFNYE